MRGIKTSIASIAAFAVVISLVTPELTAEPVSSVQADPMLARIVEIAFATGFGGPLSGKICTALGVTKDNQPFPVEQITAGAPESSRSFNASRHRGHLDVIIALKTKLETTVYLISAQGVLEKAVQQKQGAMLQEIPVAEATQGFEKEKSWWLNTWLKTHDPSLGSK
jgi:hypothetical protein